MTISKIKEMKKAGKKIAMLTAYDYETAKTLNEAGIDIILIGDSLGMVKLGQENTLDVTVHDIIYHCKAVKRGNSGALLVADMPFIPQHKKNIEVLKDAKCMIEHGGADAVKIEVGITSQCCYGKDTKAVTSMAPKTTDSVLKIIELLLKNNIPVMGHIGLTPQYLEQLGGYKVQGRDDKTASELLATARLLEATGVFSLVIECIPPSLAKQITGSLSIPTIGIGAGVECDGQVLVIDDILGLCSRIKPKFVKQYINLKPQILDAVKQYVKEVKERKFPGEENTYN
ncbi:MAG: 3-methyl-2-oxobutanoate hydroxymethyltransferase [Elusimicrobia bacterium]|nr:3-methyl-2-oxobutanoate hydroxymethyltransferase [Candidatus Liberimonas magnetica]